VQPQIITAPPAPQASIDQQIAKARAIYEADAAQIESIEAQVLSRLANDVAYKTVTTEKDAAARQLEAAKKGDEDLALAIHALSVTTQKEGALKAAALSADAGLALARQRAQSDEDSLTALLQKQGITVVAETQPAAAIAGDPSSTGSSSRGVNPPSRAGGKPTFVHSFTRKDGTFVPGHFSQ